MVLRFWDKKVSFKYVYEKIIVGVRSASYFMSVGEWVNTPSFIRRQFHAVLFYLSTVLRTVVSSGCTYKDTNTDEFTIQFKYPTYRFGRAQFCYHISCCYCCRTASDSVSPGGALPPRCYARHNWNMHRDTMSSSATLILVVIHTYTWCVASIRDASCLFTCFANFGYYCLLRLNSFEHTQPWSLYYYSVCSVWVWTEWICNQTIGRNKRTAIARLISWILFNYHWFLNSRENNYIKIILFLVPSFC